MEPLSFCNVYSNCISVKVLSTFFFELRFSLVSSISSASVGVSQLFLIVHFSVPQVTEPPRMGYTCSLPIHEYGFIYRVKFGGGGVVLVSGEPVDHGRHEKLCFNCPVLNAFSK